MANQDRHLGANNVANTGVENTVIVVLGVPPKDVRLGGNVIKLGNSAGMELSETTISVFQQRGHRVEVLKTPRLLVQRPDPNLVGVYMETDSTFVSSQEVVDPRTKRGSGRFVTTILTSEESVQGLEEIRQPAQPELLKAA